MDIKDFLAQIEEERKQKCRELGLPEDSSKNIIKQEEIRRALIEKYGLDIQSSWKEIWKYMKKAKELDTATVASEEWAKAIAGDRLDIRR